MSTLLGAWQKLVAGQPHQLTRDEVASLYEAGGVGWSPTDADGALRTRSAAEASRLERMQTILMRLLRQARAPGIVKELSSETDVKAYLMRGVGNGRRDESRTARRQPWESIDPDDARSKLEGQQLKEFLEADRRDETPRDVPAFYADLRRTIRETAHQRADGLETRLRILEDVRQAFHAREEFEQRYAGLDEANFVRRRNADYQAHKRLKDSLVRRLSESPPDGLTYAPDRLIAGVQQLVRTHDMSNARDITRLPQGGHTTSQRGTAPPQDDPS